MGRRVLAPEPEAALQTPREEGTQEDARDLRLGLLAAGTQVDKLMTNMLIKNGMLRERVSTGQCFSDSSICLFIHFIIFFRVN